MEKVTVVGIGPGGKEYMTPAALLAVEDAELLIGGERNLALFKQKQAERFIIRNNLPDMVRHIQAKKSHYRIAVLASGDPGMFGILSYLTKHFAPEELRVIPGISAVQLACARLAMPWHDAVLVSTHGRGRDPFVEAVRGKSKVVALAAPNESPAELARVLKTSGVKGKRVYLCSDLTYPSEKIQAFSLDELALINENWEQKNYIMVIVNE